MKTQLSVAALVAMAFSGGLYLGDGSQVEVVSVDPKAVELQSAGVKSYLEWFIAESGATAELICARGVISNAKDLVYCEGGRGGRLLDAAVGDELLAGRDSVAVQLRGGKVFVTERQLVQAKAVADK